MDEKWFTRTDAKVRSIHPISNQRVVRIAFTSGSTGRPKAIAYSHRTVCERLLTLTAAGIGGSERICQHTA